MKFLKLTPAPTGPKDYVLTNPALYGQPLFLRADLVVSFQRCVSRHEDKEFPYTNLWASDGRFSHHVRETPEEILKFLAGWPETRA